MLIYSRLPECKVKENGLFHSTITSICFWGYLNMTRQIDHQETQAYPINLKPKSDSNPDKFQSRKVTSPDSKSGKRNPTKQSHAEIPSLPINVVVQRGLYLRWTGIVNSHFRLYAGHFKYQYQRMTSQPAVAQPFSKAP